MKNLKKLYVAIKEVEEKTLFELDSIDEDNEIHFHHYEKDLKMIISSYDVIFSNLDGDYSFIFSYEEMQVVMELIKVLKEFE